MTEKEILNNLMELLKKKKFEYIEIMKNYDYNSIYYHYCEGKRDAITDIIEYINSKN
jgi:hypothetical protein